MTCLLGYFGEHDGSRVLQVGRELERERLDRGPRQVGERHGVGTDPEREVSRVHILQKVRQRDVVEFVGVQPDAVDRVLPSAQRGLVRKPGGGVRDVQVEGPEVRQVDQHVEEQVARGHSVRFDRDGERPQGRELRDDDAEDEVCRRLVDVDPEPEFERALEAAAVTRQALQEGSEGALSRSRVAREVYALEPQRAYERVQGPAEEEAAGRWTAARGSSGGVQAAKDRGEHFDGQVEQRGTAAWKEGCRQSEQAKTCLQETEPAHRQRWFYSR